METIFSPKMLVLLAMIIAYVIIFPILVMRKKKNTTEDFAGEPGDGSGTLSHAGAGAKKK